MPQRELPLAETNVRRPAACSDVPPAELLAWLQARGQPPLRDRQLRRWLVAGRATSFEQMTDLPRGLRERAGRRLHAARQRRRPAPASPPTARTSCCCA